MTDIQIDVRPEIIRASRLRAVIEMPEYKDTIGKWLQEAKDDALSRIVRLDATPENIQAARGSYMAIQQIQDSIDRTLSHADAILKKEMKAALESLSQPKP